jgi:hypothetical protein
MVRVPLLFRGAAVLLLAASTVVGQTPEPPVELLSIDPLGPSTPDFLRQFSADGRHPLLSLMVAGELTSFDASAAQDSTKQDSSKIKPSPQTPSTAPKTGTCEGILLDGDGCPSGNCDGLLDDCVACPTVPNFLPFACSPPPCCCRKCMRKYGRGHCCSHGPAANPYLDWPCCPAWCFYGAPLVPASDGCCGRRHLFGHKHCCGSSGHGCPYGGWGMGCDGWVDGGACGCTPPPPRYCRKCQKHSKHGYGPGCGYPYGGWGMGCDGWVDGGFCDCTPPPRYCRKCQRKHCGSYGYGYPGWDGCYGYMDPYYACGHGCGKHRGFGLFHRCRCCQPPPYPYCTAPMMMPCMDTGPFCADCVFGGDGVLDGLVMDGTIN